MSKARIKRNVLIWGAGGHGKVVADAINVGGNCTVMAFLEDGDKYTGKDTYLGRRVFRGLRSVSTAREEGADAIIFGFGNCQSRVKRIPILQQTGLDPISVVHTSAVIARDVVIEEGVAVMAGVIVNAGSHIGMHSIINTGCTIDHDCKIGMAAHVGPGVHLGGGVSIGEGTWLGLGALVSDGVRVGRNVVVGIGSVVLKDLPDSVVAYGCPARIVRNVK